MSNHHLRNKTLSLKAKGLLSYMLSLPEDWDYSIKGLAANSGDGVAAVRSALQELEEAAYLIRRQGRGVNGVFAGYEYLVFEIPQEAPSCENHTTGKLDVPLCENCTTGEGEAPLCDFPITENPSSENCTQLNTKEPKIPPIVPHRGSARREVKAEPDWKPDRFAGFWQFYPKEGRRNRQAAIRAWDKLHPDDALLLRLGQTLSRQKQREDWQRGIGIPHAATWLNQRRWEDEDAPQDSPCSIPVEREEVPLW